MDVVAQIVYRDFAPGGHRGLASHGPLGYSFRQMYLHVSTCPGYDGADVHSNYEDIIGLEAFELIASRDKSIPQDNTERPTDSATYRMQSNA